MSAWRRYAVMLGVAVLGIGALMPGAAAQYIDFEPPYALTPDWNAPGWEIQQIQHGTNLTNHALTPTPGASAIAFLTTVGGQAYSITFEMASRAMGSLGEVGYVFWYVDDANYYRVTIQGGEVKLIQRIDGVDVVIGVPSPAPPIPAVGANSWLKVSLGVTGGSINIQMGPVSLLTTVALPGSGAFGLYSASPGVAFDNFNAGLGGTVTQWDDCLVTPNPVGKVAPGGLKVMIKCQGAAPTIYAVPQGIDRATDTTHIIHFEIDPDQAPTPNTFYYRSLEAIGTTWGGGDPAPGNTNPLMDGHAVVHIFQSPEPPGSPEGRHFLIDTVPPRVQVVPPGPPLVSWFLNVGPNSAPYAALGLAMPSGDHPYPALPTSCSQMLGTTIAPYVSAPCSPDYTGGTPVDLASEDPQAFYNAASVSNGYGHPALNVVVKAYLEDPDVHTAFNLGEPTQADCDWWYGASGPRHRQASGFDVSKIPPDPQEATKVLVDGAIIANEPFPAMWLVQEGLGTIGMTKVLLQGQPFGSGGNSGYFAYSEADQLLAQWTFFDAAGAVAGIPVSYISDRMHVAGMFVGRDRARNRTDQHPMFMYRNDLPAPLRPVHVWWLLGNDLATPVHLTGQTSMFPTLDWRMNRTYDLGIDYAKPANPKLLYTFRIYACPQHGKTNKDSGPYDALQPWEGWSPGNLGLNAAYFQQVLMPRFSDPNTLLDRWLLVVATVCDEAGNVEKWDTAAFGPATGNADAVTPPAGIDSGENWIRFYVPGNSASLDTKLAVNFKYHRAGGDTDLGAATLIAYPPSADTMILGNFDITPVVPNVPAPDAFADPYVVVELEADGALVYRVGLAAPGGVIHVVLPDAAFAPPDTNHHEIPDEKYSGAGFVLGSPSKVVNYVFRATTCASKLDETGNPILLVTDTTPASFAFKVVPGSIEKYLQSSGGEQPIKVFERE